MKKLLAVIVLIVLIAAGLPFVNGILMERVFKQAVENANAMQVNNPIGYSIEITRYDRGYSHTDIELKLDLGAAKKMYGIDTVIIREHAKHGLMGVVSTVDLKENPGYSSFVNDKLGGRDPLHIESYYNILGRVESTITLDNFSITLKDDNLHVLDGKVNVSASRKMNNIKFSGIWKGFDVGPKASLGEISLNGDMSLASGSTWIGEADVNFKGFKVKENNTDFEISDIKMHSLSNIDRDANSLRTEQLYSFNSIRAKDFKADEASLHIVVDGIKLDALEEFKDQYMKATSSMMSKINFKDPYSTNNDQMKREMAQISLKLTAAYEKLLKKDLELQLSDGHIKLPQGEINGAFTLKLLKDMTFAQFLPLINEPQSLLDVFYIKTDISLPAGLASDKPQLVQPAFPQMKTGLFVKEGDYLVNKIETKDGKLFLNGDTVPLDEIVKQRNARVPPMNQY